MGIQNMWVFKFVGTQNIMGTSNLWIKPYGYLKYGWVFSNVWVFKICGYSIVCVFKMHGCSNLRVLKKYKLEILWVNKICWLSKWG